jgi:hypothetical protein
MSNERELEPICPECGSADIMCLGYHYHLDKVFYECQDCESQGGSELFDQSEESFDVAVFDSDDDSNAEVIEGSISWDEAFDLANMLFNSGKHYGVEIIDCDPDNMESIVWIKTKDHD